MHEFQQKKFTFNSLTCVLMAHVSISLYIPSFTCKPKKIMKVDKLF